MAFLKRVSPSITFPNGLHLLFAASLVWIKNCDAVVGVGCFGVSGPV